MRTSIFLALSIVFIGCPTKLPVLEQATCEGITCGGKGTCALVPEMGAACFCSAGFRSEGTTCVPVVAGQECSGVTCSSHGQCIVVQGQPASPLCRCDTGYREVGNTNCVAVSDPCAGQTCSGQGTCAVVNGTSAVCACNAGFVASGLSCIEQRTDGGVLPTTGDGGTGDAGIQIACAFDTDGVLTKLAAAVCAKNVPCCRTKTKAVCEAELFIHLNNTVFPGLEASRDAGLVELNCGALDTCALALSTKACSEWPKGGFEENVSCISTVKGLVPVGGTCRNQWECTPGNGCFGDPRRCVPLRSVNQSCNHSSTSTTEVCNVVLGLECADGGIISDGGVLGSMPTPGVCRPSTKIGLEQSCQRPASSNAPNPCGKGMICGTSNTCQWETCEFKPFIPSCSSVGSGADAAWFLAVFAALGLSGRRWARSRARS
jgi:hypothetical protein